MPRFQIRLRTLLLLVVVVSIPVAWYGHRWREEFRRNSVVAYLVGRGATVSSLPSLSGPTFGVVFNEAELRTHAGSTALRSAPKLTLEDFEQLRLLPVLSYLTIEGNLLTNEALGEIGTLDRLRRLQISHCTLDDEQLQVLAGLTNLKTLDLEATQVTDDGVARLCAKLPGLVVNDD
ncbi:MAG: hypothetical protein K8U03_16485 [Planctomycetia bacterium]|nr:hypothetical protein [Planctomycetia bacterium]